MHDLFVSYSVRDMNVAENVCSYLENSKIKCWMAPRDIEPGADWGKSIIKAINNSKIMVLIFSADSDKSPQVLREVERATNRGIPIVPFKIENREPTKQMSGLISDMPGLNAYKPPLEVHLEKLANKVKILIKKDRSKNKTLTVFLRIILAILSTILLICFLLGTFLILQGDGGFYPTILDSLFIILGLPSFFLAIYPQYLANKLNKINIRKRYNLLIMAMIILMLLVLSTITTEIPNEFSNQGVFFKIPSNLTYESQGSGSINFQENVKFPSLNSSDPSVMFNITINPLPATDLQSTYNQEYSNYQIPEYQSISDTILTVDGVTALQKVYEIEIDGKNLKKRDLWLVKNGKLYQLKFTAPIESFEKYQADLEIIIKSFHVQ